MRIILGIILFFYVCPFSLIYGGQKEIILATTTSIHDSGLLDFLIPLFEKRTGYFVKVIAVGSGQAIALGQRGEADVLLVHSPTAEKKFMEDGYGIHRRMVMHNDFIIVGPTEDPAKINGIRLAAGAFKNIALNKVIFLSRGDESGTHVKEMEIWKISGVNPEKERWYHQTGLGMGQTLNIANEKRAYTLTDRATYLAIKRNLNLNILVEGDPKLLNIYHVIEVNPARWKKVNGIGARLFAEFIVSKEVQEIIKAFGVDKFGSPLFYPATGKLMY